MTQTGHKRVELELVILFSVTYHTTGGTWTRREKAIDSFLQRTTMNPAHKDGILKLNIFVIYHNTVRTSGTLELTMCFPSPTETQLGHGHEQTKIYKSGWRSVLLGITSPLMMNKNKVEETVFSRLLRRFSPWKTAVRISTPWSALAVPEARPAYLWVFLGGRSLFFVKLMIFYVAACSLGDGPRPE